MYKESRDIYVIEKLQRVLELKSINLVKKNENSTIYIITCKYGKSILKIHYNMEKFFRESVALRNLNKNLKFIPTVYLCRVLDDFTQVGIIIEEYFEGEILKDVFHFRPKRDQERIIYEVGRCLGQIHKNCVNDCYMLGMNTSYYNMKVINDQKYDWINLCMQKIERYHSEMRMYNSSFIQVTEYINIIKLAILNQKIDFKSVFLHGDFGFRNIIITGDETLKVIDFEYGMIGDSQFDFAKLLFNDMDFSKDIVLREYFFSGWQSEMNEDIDWNRLWIYLALQGLGAFCWVQRQGCVECDDINYAERGVEVLKLACQNLKN